MMLKTQAIDRPRHPIIRQEVSEYAD